MKFATALAFASAPSAVHSWNLVFPDPMLSSSSMLARQRALANRMLQQTDRVFQDAHQLSSSIKTHRYDLVDDETRFQLTVDVPGVNMEDIDIRLDDGMLTVRGQRTAEDDNSKFISKFSQSFSLDPTVDVDQFSATLDKGVLVVTAPKDMKKLEENVRKIPITMAAAATEAIAEAPAAEEDTIDLDKVVEEKKETAAEHVEVKKKDE